MGAREREEVAQALRDLNRIIRNEYPELEKGTELVVAEDGETVFKWGVGDGFMMALRGVVDAALPGWNKQ